MQNNWTKIIWKNIALLWAIFLVLNLFCKNFRNEVFTYRNFYHQKVSILKIIKFLISLKIFNIFVLLEVFCTFLNWFVDIWLKSLIQELCTLFLIFTIYFLIFLIALYSILYLASCYITYDYIQKILCSFAKLNPKDLN